MKPALNYDTLDEQAECLAARIENVKGVRNLYRRQLHRTLRTKLSDSMLKARIAGCDRNVALLQIELARIFSAH